MMSSTSFESTPAAAMPWQNLFVTTLHGHVLEGDSQIQTCMEKATQAVQELKEEINKLTERENASNARLTKMEADWAESKQVQQAQNLGLRELNSNLKQQLLSSQQSQAENQEKWQGIVLSLVAEKTALLQQVAELKRQHEIDVGTIEQKQSEVNAFGAQMTQMKQEIARYAEKNHSSSQKIMDVQKLADTRLNDITALEERYANLQSVDTARQGHIQTLETQVANLGLQLEAALRNEQEHLVLFNSTNVALHDKLQLIDEKDGQINSHLNKIAELERAYQSKEREINALQTQINALQQTNISQGNTLAQQQGVIGSQQQTILAKDADIYALQQKIYNASVSRQTLANSILVMKSAFRPHRIRQQVYKASIVDLEVQCANISL